MPVIAKAGTPVKGSPTEFTLDKSALATVASVAADAYFSDSSNWKEVVLNYKSSTGKQKEIVKFDASLASPTSNFSVSLKAKDIFQIHKIVIKDFDGGFFEVPRSALNAAEFDVDMSPPLAGVIWDVSSNYTTQSNGGLTKITSVVGQSAMIKATAATIVLDGSYHEIAFTFNGYLPSASQPAFNNPKIGACSPGGNPYGEEIAIVPDGTNNPFLSILGSASYRLSAYGLPPLTTGLNTFKVIKESGIYKIHVNGTTASYGSIGFPSICPFVALNEIGNIIVSTTTL